MQIQNTCLYLILDLITLRKKIMFEGEHHSFFMKINTAIFFLNYYYKLTIWPVNFKLAKSVNAWIAPKFTMININASHKNAQEQNYYPFYIKMNRYCNMHINIISNISAI